MKVVNVDFVFHGPPSEFIGCSMHVSPLYASSGQEHRKAEWVMTTAVLSLTGGGAAKFAAPHNKRFIEQAALLQIGEQTSDRLIDAAATLGQARGDASVVVPSIATAALPRIVQLHEADSAFHKSTRQQALTAKNVRCGIV